MEYLVIDSGGTFIKYAVMNENADILEKGKVKTPDHSKHTLEDYLEILDSIFQQYGRNVKGIAMSSPGIIDSDTGYCYSGGSLTYVSGQNMAELLKARCKVPVTIENDGKCVALAEMWKGSLKDVKNGIALVLGTAVGGGLIINGSLYKGRHFSAGEFSYMAVEEKRIDQEEGYWGSTNGADALAKYTSIETGIPQKELDGIKIFEMAGKGDERVLKALNVYTKKLAVQIYNLQALLDVEAVTIGGGISRQPLLLEYVKKNIRDLCENHPYRKLSPFIPMPVVTTCYFFDDSNLVGALYHYLNSKGLL